MLALIASVIVVAYVLIPGTVYRAVFSFFIPLKTFQRTKVDEIRFAVLTSLLPFVLAVLLASPSIWTGSHPFFSGHSAAQSGAADRRVVVAGSYSEEIFRKNPSQFWESAGRITRRQARFLTWYYALVGLEAFCVGGLSRRLSQLLGKPALGWFAGRVLMPSISEWYLLLTPALLPAAPQKRVMLDILTSEDHLYRGDLGSYFLDLDGKLSGVLLKNASRFDRRRYLRNAEAGNAGEAERYWKHIPGPNLYLPYERIVSLNIRYEPIPSHSLSKAVQQLLKRLNIDATVRLEPGDTQDQLD